MQFLIKTGTRTDEAIDLSSRIFKIYKGFMLSIHLVNVESKWTVILSFQNLPSEEVSGYGPETRMQYIIGSAKIIHQFQTLNHFPVAFMDVDSALLSEILGWVEKAQEGTNTEGIQN